MSRLQAQVVLTLGDATRTFALKTRQLENLEKEVGATVSEIAYRVVGFRPSIHDIKHIIILGLEGGGMPPEQALKIYDRYCEGRPLYDKNDESSPALIAARVMEAAWFGVEDVVEASEGKEDAAPQAAEQQSTSQHTEQASSEQE